MAARVFEREVELFRHGGGLRMAEALRLGINRKKLYAMRDAGVIEPVSRGVYRVASLDPLAHPDLVTVAKRVPQGVFCLIGALVHELTTQVPHVIDVALERGKTKPRLDDPPTRFFWFSGPAFHEGIETHELDGVPVRIYDPEKTLVDCFRYRNQIGMDVALEALRLWPERRKKKLDVPPRQLARNLERVVREVCAADVEPDGMVFDATTVKTERIKEDADYEGVRVRFVRLLGKARVAMQIDVGFGDVVTPGAVDITYPALLDFPAPALSGYPRETVVAEKFQAMVYLRTLNSRMKDFYDVWLARQFAFDGAVLAPSDALASNDKSRDVSTRSTAGTTGSSFERPALAAGRFNRQRCAERARIRHATSRLDRDRSLAAPSSDAGRREPVAG